VERVPGEAQLKAGPHVEIGRREVVTVGEEVDPIVGLVVQLAAEVGRDGAEIGAETAAHHSRGASEVQDNRELWLVFRVNRSGQLALPLSLISRLEELEPSTVEVSGNHEVVQYRGQIMPLVPVAKTLGMEPENRGQSLSVIVYSQEGRSVGLVVSEILEIVEEEITVEGRGQQAGLLGSAVIHQRVTNLLDVPGLLAAAQIPMETRA